MRALDRAELQRLLDTSATLGNLNHSETTALFLYTRADAPKGSMLRDLGDTVAHDQRDRGVAYDYVNGFVDHLLETFEHGGRLVVEILFDIDQLLIELADFAQSIGLAVDRSGLRANASAIAPSIARAIGETTIKLRQPGILCTFSVSPEGQPAYELEFAEDRVGVIPVFATARMAFPLLVDFANRTT